MLGLMGALGIFPAGCSGDGGEAGEGGAEVPGDAVADVGRDAPPEDARGAPEADEAGPLRRRILVGQPGPRTTRWAPDHGRRTGLRAPPEGFVDLREAVPGVFLDIRYHGKDNFTGAPLPGYDAPGAWLRVEAAEALARVQEELSQEGLALLVYDAYRPQRATEAMVAWALRSDNAWTLEQGYIASRSSHAHGTTVDLTLVSQATGEPLDMGTPWDTFSDRSHVDNAVGRVKDNRDRLQGAMASQGFRPYSKEWWHFRFPLDGTAPRDVPYGCHEVEEGSWAAPEGWAEPGWTPPEPAVLRRCEGPRAQAAPVGGAEAEAAEEPEGDAAGEETAP